MIKVVIPVSGNLLSENFGECSYYEIYEIDKKAVVSKIEEVSPLKALIDLSKWVEHSGITDVIVYDIDETSMKYFANTKINLFVGVAISTPKQLIDEYLKGTLKSDFQNFTKKLINGSKTKNSNSFC